MRKYIDHINQYNTSLGDPEDHWLVEAAELDEANGKWAKFVTGAGAAAALAMGAAPMKAHAGTPLPQEVDACHAQKNLSWCDSVQKNNLAADQDTAMKEAAAEARNKMQYDLNDQSSHHDEWRSHDDDVQAGKMWKGDCDDLTLTTIEAAIRHGVSETRLYRALVAINQRAAVGSGTKTVMGHMVGIYEDTQGNFWVIGDTDADAPMVSVKRYPGIKYVSPVALGKGWFHVEDLGKIDAVKMARAKEQNGVQLATAQTPTSSKPN